MKQLFILTAAIMIASFWANKAPRMFVREQAVIYSKVYPTPTPTPTEKEIIDYIVQTFEPEGKHTILKALNCFYSESGLRWDAIHLNTNKTYDGGIAQINDVHKMSLEERLDYKANIQKAYEIYKRSGWRPWYGLGCR